MDAYYLIVEWDYNYDKEGTWFDSDSGEARYALAEGSSYPLPHIKGKILEITSVTNNGDAVTAEVYVDHHTVTVCSGGESVMAHVSDSYSVCGDSVHQSLDLKLTIEKE